MLCWYAREFELVVSTDTLTELDDVLRRRHIGKKYPISESDIESYVNYLRNFAEVPPDQLTLDAVPNDPKDNHVLAAALETSCEYVVSGDRHLLDLHEFQGTHIVTPREFLAKLTPSH